MTKLFYQILDMSLIGSLVLLIVMAARVFLKKFPRIISYVLWLVVLFRLLCPWSPESPVSLIPQALPNSVQHSELPAVTQEISEQLVQASQDETSLLREDPVEEFSELASSPFVLTLVLPWLWPLGMVGMGLYSLISLLRLKRQLVGAVRQDGNIYLADGIQSPFVLGLFRPKIYLPSTLSVEEQSYILLHEQTHIRRGDHLWKLLGFLALTLHWFNPLVWLAFSCGCKDMEVSCDESVLKKLGPEIQADYSSSLLRLATGRSNLSGVPLAFGEGDTKGRIKHILKYKKPILWLTMFALILALALTIVLAVNPVSDSNFFGTRYMVHETLYHGSISYSFTITPDNAPSFILTEDGELYTGYSASDWSYAGTLAETELTLQERNALFPNSNNQVQEIMDCVITVYEAQWQVSGSPQDYYYYLFEYKPFYWNNSVLYLAMGQEKDEMRWLFRLETPNDGLDLEYLEFAIQQTNPSRRAVQCFALYEDKKNPGWVLAGWTANNLTNHEIGVMEVTYKDDQHRRTYDVDFGVIQKTPGGKSAIGTTFYEDFVTYVVLATNDLSVTEYQGYVGQMWYEVKTDQVPALVVERVPYTWADYLTYFKYLFCKTETTTEEIAAPEETLEESNGDLESSDVSVVMVAPVYDLTENAPVTLFTEKLAEYAFRTNSTAINVTVSHSADSVTIWLCRGGDRILTHTAAEGETVTFTHLTSAAEYTLEIEGPSNTMVTVTD